MYKEWFARLVDDPVLDLPIAAMVLFAVVFAAVAARALRTRPAQLAAVAALPLSDDARADHARGTRGGERA